MLYNEEEVLRICKKYGIKAVKKSGYPIYEGKEMDENFSVEEILREPIINSGNVLVVRSKASISMPFPIDPDAQEIWNSYPTECHTNLIYESGPRDNRLVSSISYDNQNSYAA